MASTGIFSDANIDIFKSVSGIFGQIQASNIASAGAESSAQSALLGGQIAAQGATLTAAGLRQSAQSIRDASIFNLGVDNLNTQRRLKSLNRQFQRTVGAQQVQAASSGLNVTSKSFMLLRNEAISEFGEAVINLKIDAINERKAKLFEAELQRSNLENQARTAEFRAASERALAQTRAGEARFSGAISRFGTQQKIASEIPTLLGQIFQDKK